MDSVSSFDDPRSGGATVAPPTLRLACAVSADERRLFLSHATAALEALPVELIWICTDEAGAAVARLQAVNPHIVISGWSTPPLAEDWLRSPGCALRYVCHLAGSVRHLVPRAFLERGGMVTNWGDIPSGAVAEQALLLALAALRNQRGWQEIVRRTEEGGSHVERLRTRTLFGRRVGIHGFGRVARALVPLLRPFGVVMRAYSSGVPRELIVAQGVAPSLSLKALAAEADVFFECEALTVTSAGSVSPEVLATLPDGAVLVNVGRGGLVDEVALLRETESGRIRVALDVVIAEPLVPASAFCRVRDAILSPHIAGPTFDQYAQCASLAARNVACFLRQEPLTARVSLEELDRST